MYGSKTDQNLGILNNKSLIKEKIVPDLMLSIQSFDELQQLTGS